MSNLLSPMAASGQVRTPIAHTSGTVSSLGDALRSEARLLADLVAIMRRQREAVARDDLDAVDDSVFATHRVLVTLGEARRRRRSLNHLLGEGDDLSLSAIEDFFVGDVPDELRAAVDLVTESARTLQREVEVNRRVLRHAIDSADQFVRSLYGGPAPAPERYGAPGASSTQTTYAPRAGGNILDRRV